MCQQQAEAATTTPINSTSINIPGCEGDSCGVLIGLKAEGADGCVVVPPNAPVSEPSMLRSPPGAAVVLVPAVDGGCKPFSFQRAFGCTWMQSHTLCGRECRGWSCVSVECAWRCVFHFIRKGCGPQAVVSRANAVFLLIRHDVRVTSQVLRFVV